MFPLKIDPSNVSHEYINTLPTLLHVIKKLIRRFLSRARPPFLKLLVDGSVKPIFRVILSYFVQGGEKGDIQGARNNGSLVENDTRSRYRGKWIEIRPSPLRWYRSKCYLQRRGVICRGVWLLFKYLEWVFFIYDDEMIKNGFGLTIM